MFLGLTLNTLVSADLILVRMFAFMKLQLVQYLILVHIGVIRAFIVLSSTDIRLFMGSSLSQLPGIYSENNAQETFLP